MSVSHPQDVLHTVNLVTQCLCIPIVTLFVGLRFYTRLHFKQSLGVEDCKPKEKEFGHLLVEFPANSLPDGCTVAWVS